MTMRFIRRDAYVDARKMPYDFKVKLNDEVTIRGKVGDYLVSQPGKLPSVVESAEFESTFQSANDADPFSDDLRKELERDPLPAQAPEDDGGCVAPASDAELERAALEAKRASN